MNGSGWALRSIGLALSLMWLLGACASRLSSDGATPALTGTIEAGVERATATRVEGTRMPLLTTAVEDDMMSTENVSPGLQGLVDQALTDLAKRLVIDAGQIEVVEVKAVVWPDGSLGCPEPGVAYTQVQREGLFIRLSVGKRVYQYHSGGGRPPFLCEHPRVPEDGTPSPGLGID
jgi:hypothetical protein